MDQIFIQHRFTISRDGIMLSDALTYPKDQYDQLTEGDIEAAKEARFTAFKAHMENPPQAPEIPVEVEIAAIDSQLQELTTRKTDLQKKLPKEK